MSEFVDLQSLVDSHEEPFVVIDPDFHILALNRAYEQAYGVSLSDAIGRCCHELSHGASRPCPEAGVECPQQQVRADLIPRSCLHTHRDRHGRKHWVRVSMFPLRTAGGRICLGQRITEMAQEEAADPDGGERMVGESQPFLTLIEQLLMAARSHMPVLLLGETGTGKELAARFIHRHCERREGPFQTVDCTTLNEQLIESELFGHERGAFTGSVGARSGLFEQADGGTLFLDEIGDLPLAMQAKLLRALESGEFRRVGGRELHHVNVRVVCATNRHLWETVQAGAFREDLYHRIACLTIHLPPLGERVEDIPLVADALLEQLYRCNGRRQRLTGEAAELLAALNYSGNIRELRNILFGAAALATGPDIEARHIRPLLRRAPALRAAESAAPPASAPVSAPAPTIAALEAEHIRAVMEQVHGHRGRAAEVLGISHRTLYRKLKQHGL